ncbi:MAG: phenylacetate--CoA ligase family protein [Desulfobacteraceae bacterium]|nr:phenylacetate--CoA ligase family protein [Desulfobacteraceae bacterium]
MIGLTHRVYLKTPVFIQNLFCTAYGIRESHRRYGGKFKDYVQWLNESQWWPIERLKEYQNEQLRMAISSAYEHVPFWRKRFDSLGIKPQDIKCTEDLRYLPTLTRSEVLSAGKDITCTHIPRRRLVRGHTSGTTGTALQLFFVPEYTQFAWAVWWRQRSIFGIELKHRQANFGGRLIVPYYQTKPPFWRENRAFPQTVFSQFHMKPEFLKYYVDRLNQQPFDYFSGYPSTIYLLANYLEETGESLKYRPKAVFVGAETLLEYQKELITKHIGRPTGHYGAAEYGGAASKCRYEYYHIDMEFGVLEVIPIKGIKQSDDEVVGKVVVTAFANPAMPLIRYELGDIATYSPDFKCSCGRQTPVLKYIDGRAESYLVTADGRYVGRLDHIFKDMSWVKESQIIQDRKGQMVIKLVQRREHKQSDIDFLLRECTSRLGKDMKIDMEFVDEIPRTKAGKFRAVISKVDTLLPKKQG